ncbi:MAG TPA: hypothetical protein VJA18_03425 [Candidatus Nanoarchaeia archaeon]|nr:hypothetical protein [Candidatus Nanoarchaeia archaeon]
MVDKLYSGKGKTLEEAEAQLEENARNAGVTNLEGTVSYEVSMTGKRGKVVSGKLHTEYPVAFASALSAAKVNPDQYDAGKHLVEVTARAEYQTLGEARQPSGSAPSSYSGKGLTNLF